MGRLGLLDFFLQSGGLLEPPSASPVSFAVTPSHVTKKDHSDVSEFFITQFF